MKTVNILRCLAIVAIFSGALFQCASPKLVDANSFEKQVPFKIKSVYFQEWYAGIKHGGTGYTLYLPVVNKVPGVAIEEVYFRNLKSRFQLQDGRYIAILKNPGKQYVFNKPDKPENYPFELSDNECVIAYSDKGTIKYHKLRIDKELAGTYYEHGAPSIFVRGERSSLATLDEEDN